MSESGQYLYVIRPERTAMLLEGPSSEEEEILKGHISYLKELTEQGVVILAGRTQTADEKTFGIVVFHADSEESAHRIMQEDPVVKQGVMRAELFPFKAAYQGKAFPE
ncbi:MAG: hypothetical protein HQM13_07155 [SAR324 cluster bacterium]|nr:hypothetical protein [SAR324 cluster bacterium]